MTQKKRRSRTKKFTIIVIPENTTNPLRIGLPRRTIMAMAAVLSVLLIIFMSVCTSYYIKRNEIRRVDQILGDNKDKQETIQTLNQEIEEIKKQQGDVAKKQEEIKKLMGIKADTTATAKPKDGGKGGADSTPELGNQNEEVLLLAQTIKTELARQDQELDELLARVTNNTEFFRSVPNLWPAKGQITSDYGWRNSPFGGKAKTFHDGLDIAASVGTPVAAAGDGKVIFTGWRGAYGNAVLIDHGSGFTTLYGHNSSILVKEGEVVKKGQVIAKMGNTGRSTGPHVHFSVFKWGVCTDPRVYLP